MRTVVAPEPADVPVPEVFTVAPGIHVALARSGEPVPREAPGHRAAQSLAARALLRHLLATTVGVAAEHLPILAGRAGQPYLPDRPDLGVSLSHDGGWVAAGVGVGAAIGVDVQAPVPVRPALVRRCCTPEAGRYIAGLPGPDRDREFAWIWTVQEACVKAEGTGLAGRPWTVPVPVGRHRGTWRGYRWHSLRDRTGPPLSCAHRPLHDDTGSDDKTARSSKKETR